MRNKNKLYIKIFIITIVVGGILGYTYYKTQDLLLGPQITIQTPEDGATLDEPLVTIIGMAQNASDITLNGKRVFMDENGNIQEEILLMYGYNIFEFRVKGKFGREITKTLELVYK